MNNDNEPKVKLPEPPEGCRCGSRAVMRYEPGATYVHCIAEGITKAALPDWQPEKMADEWGKLQACKK
jgi:hypothetical protein